MIDLLIIVIILGVISISLLISLMIERNKRKEQQIKAMLFEYLLSEVVEKVNNEPTEDIEQ